MREPLPLKFILVLLGVLVLVPTVALGAGPTTVLPAPLSTPAAAATPQPLDGASAAAESNLVKAHALVAAAINMTDSAQALKLLWQATDLEPSFEEAYIYLGLYYNSRSQFDKVVDVYQKLIKYHPKQASAYLNIGEAYMSFQPPKFDAALPYYRKALELEPSSSFAALRIGEIYSQQGDRANAVRYLTLASRDRAKNPNIADEAERFLRQTNAP